MLADAVGYGCKSYLTFCIIFILFLDFANFTGRQKGAWWMVCRLLCGVSGRRSIVSRDIQSLIRNACKWFITSDTVARLGESICFYSWMKRQWKWKVSFFIQIKWHIWLLICTLLAKQFIGLVSDFDYIILNKRLMQKFTFKTSFYAAH